MPDEEVVRRLLLSVDARGYGAATGRRHREIQDGLLKVLNEAARRAGLKRSEWDRQPAGDGELAVLPPTGESEPAVVERLPWELHDALRRHNRDLRDEARLRLRLAVHFGSAARGPNGYVGAGPVTVSRLCDLALLKRALEMSGADLAVIFSRQIYTDTIQQEHTLLDLADLHKVRATRKEFDEDAWIWIPGHDVSALSLGDPEDPERAEDRPALGPADPVGPDPTPGPLPKRAISPPARNDVFDGTVISATGLTDKGPY